MEKKLYEAIQEVVDLDEKMTPSQKRARERSRDGADRPGMGGQRTGGGHADTGGGEYEMGDRDHGSQQPKKIKGAKPQGEPGEQPVGKKDKYGDVRTSSDLKHDIQKRLALKKKRELLSKERQKLDAEYDPEIVEAIMNRVMEKMTPANIASRERHRVGGRQGRGMSGPGSHQEKGTVGDLEKKRHGKQLAKQGAAGKDSNVDPTTKRTQKVLKLKLLAKQRERLSKKRKELDWNSDPSTQRVR